MTKRNHFAAWSLSVAAALAAGACGGSSDKATTTRQGNGNAGALSAEAQSQATGDIPDNQVFLTFHNRQAGYAIKYPEGWTQRGSSNNVTFKDKNNLVHISVASGPAPTVASATAALTKLRKSDPSLVVTSAPRAVTIKGNRAIKSGYSTQSKPNPVTGKRVTLLVDRYQFAGARGVATVDLGTPKGVDNVDAYRLMSESFKWN